MTGQVGPGTLRFRRVAFWGYAAIVFTGTHWPKLRLPGTGRPDLLIHLSVFGTWAAILMAASFFGPALSLRNIGRVAIIAPIYAAIDEGLQAIPFVHRTAAFDDWGANCTGIAVVILSALLIRRFRRGTESIPADRVSSQP